MIALLLLATPFDAALAAACSSTSPCSRGGACTASNQCQRGLTCEGAWLGRGTCQPPPGDYAYCTSSYPCGVGLGDCDTAQDCTRGLVCATDTGDRYGFAADVDTCELPLGHASRCTSATPCDVAEGDCDSDVDCLAGLECQATGDRYGIGAPDTCELPLGHNDRCTPGTPCDADEGDCDSDVDCLAGLECRHDAGQTYGYAAWVDVCVPPQRRCPEDWFAPEDRTTEAPRFRFPMRAGPGTFGPGWMQEPAYVHFDRAGVPLVEDGLVATFDGLHVTYDSHSGTDYPLAFLQFTQAGQTVEAVAAADGVVTRVTDVHPDECYIDLVPWSPTFQQIQCNGPDPDSVVNNVVEVCHADGTVTQYFHVMEGSAAVDVGDEVACGDELALVGSAGRSSAPHLHFEVRDPAGTPVDPYAVSPSASRWVDQGNVWFGYPAETCE
jgi:hypothetical protein